MPYIRAASASCITAADRMMTNRATIELRMIPPVAAGSRRYRRHTPRSRSATMAVGIPKHAPPSTVTVSNCPISRHSGGLVDWNRLPYASRKKIGTT